MYVKNVHKAKIYQINYAHKPGKSLLLDKNSTETINILKRKER